MTSKTFIEQLYDSILGRNSDAKGLSDWTHLIESRDKNAFEVYQEFFTSSEFTQQVKPLIQLFYTTLGRVPEVASYDWWLETYRQGDNLEAVGNQLLGSDEFQTQFGDLNDADFVSQLFQNALGRAPEAAGQAYWLEQMQAGMSRAEVAIGIATSEELEVLRGQEAEIILQYQSILSINPSAEQLAAAKTLTSEQLTAQLFKTAGYSGADVPYLTDNGVVVDGYVAGATVFIDADGDGVQGPNEPSVITDAQGNFDFGNQATFGQLIMTGGTDISTGKTFEGTMTAPSGATVVNPLTTLIDNMTSNGVDKATTLDEAARAVQQALGLDESIDLLNYDPINEASKADASETDIALALAVQKANTTVNTLISQTAALLDGTGVSSDEETAIQNAYAALGEKLENADGTPVDLTSTSVVQDIIQDSATQAGANENQQSLIQSLAGDASTTITNLTKAIDEAGTNSNQTTEEILNDIAAIQIVSEAIENQMEQGGQSGDVSDTTSNTSGSNLDNAVSEAGKNVGDVDGDGDNDPDSTPPVDNGGGDSGPEPDTSGPIATLSYSTDIQSTSVPTDTSASVKPGDTLRIFATFNETIDEKTGAVISIGNIEFELVSDAPMIKLDSTHYYYDVDIPLYNAGVEIIISTAQDNLGNVITQTPINNSFTIDNQAPTLSSLSSTTADGSYKQDTTINITAITNEPIQTGNTITVKLDTEDTVILTAPNDGTTLTGSYTVGAGDTSSDLTINSFTIGSVTDSAGNVMTSLTVPSGVNNLAGSSDIVIDTTAPTVHETTPISKEESGGSVADTYDSGDRLTLKFSEAVQVSALTSASLDISNGHILGHGSTVLPVGSEPYTDTFTVTLGTGTNLIPGDSLTLSHQAIVDAAGNTATSNAVFTLPQFLPSVSNIAITSATGIKNNYLNSGDVLSVKVTMSKTVTVTGTPQLALNIGGATVQADYASGTGSTELIFNYTISNETDSNGISIEANSLLLNGGTINDSSTNDEASLTHSSVTDNGSYLVDTTAATVTDVSSTISDGSYKTGQVLPITVTFDEVVAVSGTPQLTLETGSTDRTIDYHSGTGTNTLTFNYTVQAGDTSADLDYLATTSLQLGEDSIRDTAGNNASLTLSSPGSAHSLGANKAIVIDTSSPVAHPSTPITYNDLDSSDTYTENDKLTIQFNEPVLVSSLAIDYINISNNSLGSGASLEASNDSNGYSDTFEITLGTTPTLTGGETLSTTAANVVDAAGNTASTNVDFTIPGFVDTSTVVFDLINGKESSHNGGGGAARTFEAGVAYKIYIRVNNDYDGVNWDTHRVGNSQSFSWTGANNLGDDDVVIFVGNGELIDIFPDRSDVSRAFLDRTFIENNKLGIYSTVGHTGGFYSERLSIHANGHLQGKFIHMNAAKTNTYSSQVHNVIDLWDGTMSNMQNGVTHYLKTMPVGILTSQGLV